MTYKDDDDTDLKELALAMALLDPDQKYMAEEFGRLCCEGCKNGVFDLSKKKFLLNWYVKPSSHKLVMKLLEAFLFGDVEQTGETVNLEIVHAMYVKLHPADFIECTIEEFFLLLMLLYSLWADKFENLTWQYDRKEFEDDVIQGFFGRIAG